MKKIALVFIIAVAVIGVSLYWMYSGKNNIEENEQKLEEVNIEKGNIIKIVTASGKIVPEKNVEIKGKASGEVKEIFFDIADHVKQGDLLFRLDTVDEERNVARLTANLQIAQAKVEQTQLAIEAAKKQLEADRNRAEADLESAVVEKKDAHDRLNRAKELYQKKVLNKEEYDAANTKYAQTNANLINKKARLDDLSVQELMLKQKNKELVIAKAQLENDQIALDDAKQRLIDTKVFSPINGVVTERNIQEGTIISSGISNVGGGTTAMVLTDLEKIYSMAAVDEANIYGVKPGVNANITVDSYQNKVFKGTVERVAVSGKNEANVVTFDVKIEVNDEKKDLLKPEMTTNVSLVIDKKENVLKIPLEAINKRTVQNKENPEVNEEETFVYLANDKKEIKIIKIGIDDGNMAEVIEGLEENQKVYYEPGGQSIWKGKVIIKKPHR